ncbi:hypothetical protein Pcinc_002306 [Petrolisthes cinctipes]|uniref:Uncharacterized protein n=1 Tax=Petrolisthes cinctipes TaxID=88211 RepID=A0AAE1GJ19_PETCI|nr:hypothetical protein Pcinc_002306 [Petrolisthes cinctipes]
MAEISTINARLDAIQYLAENCEPFYTLQDTEQRCEMRLNYVIALKNTLELLDPLANTLETPTNPLLASVRGVSHISSLPLSQAITLHQM